MTKLARMRTLDGCIKQLKQDDPKTEFTRFALRRMVLSGQISYVKTGNKYLVNYDALVSLLNNGIESQSCDSINEPDINYSEIKQ